MVWKISQRPKRSKIIHSEVKNMFRHANLCKVQYQKHFPQRAVLLLERQHENDIKQAVSGLQYRSLVSLVRTREGMEKRILSARFYGELSNSRN